MWDTFSVATSVVRKQLLFSWKTRNVPSSSQSCSRDLVGHYEILMGQIRKAPPMLSDGTQRCKYINTEWLIICWFSGFVPRNKCIVLLPYWVLELLLSFSLTPCDSWRTTVVSVTTVCIARDWEFKHLCVHKEVILQILIFNKARDFLNRMGSQSWILAYLKRCEDESKFFWPDESFLMLLCKVDFFQLACL